jgi:exodeoxyribonuclease-5
VGPVADIILTEDQAVAVDLIQKWYSTEEESRKSMFVLSGYAGTGKSFLIDYVVGSVLGMDPSDVAFCTPTGKAASVLIQRGRVASTIHRLIYTAEEKEVEETVAGVVIKKSKLTFKKRSSIGEFKLIILDEVSMVDQVTMSDLLSFNIPVLASGDAGQLPPVTGYTTILSNPDATLSQIVRQAEGDPIIRLATMARHGSPLPYGDYGSALVIDKRTLSPGHYHKLLLAADQVICGTNRTRRNLNSLVRTLKGINVVTDPLPLPGEKVVCTLNNWEISLSDDRYNLVNGTVGYAGEVTMLNTNRKLGRMSFTPEFLPGKVTENIVFDVGGYGEEYSHPAHSKALIMADGTAEIKEKFTPKAEKETDAEFADRIKRYIVLSKKAAREVTINRFEYGYALSCHKSQGSEFGKVLVIDESFSFGEDRHKWLYTAVTRAKKRLVIIR